MGQGQSYHDTIHEQTGMSGRRFREDHKDIDRETRYLETHATYSHPRQVGIRAESEAIRRYGPESVSGQLLTDHAPIGPLKPYDG